MATLVIVLVFSRLSRVALDDGGWKLAAVTPVAPPASTARGGRVTSRASASSRCSRVLVLIPVFFSRASESFLWTRVLVFAIAGCSLTILTGWAGQLSLGQFGFAAVGGLTTVKLVGDDGVLGLHHLPWGVAVALGVLVGAAVAVLIGLPALRIPGLYLAVTTLAFAVFVVGVAGRAGHVRRHQRAAARRWPSPTPAIVDFSSRRSYYYLCLAFLLACVALVAQLRRTGIGRSVIAVRDNPASAAGMTISTTRMKLLAFAVSGGHGRARRVPAGDAVAEQHAGGDVRARGVGAGRRHRGDRRTRRAGGSGARRAVGRRASRRSGPTSRSCRSSCRASASSSSCSSPPAASPASSAPSRTASPARRRATTPVTHPEPASARRANARMAA